MNTDSERDENSYRSILKGTSILGGVQIFLLLLNLIRGKFVALFLGADGMGVSALFASSQNTVQRFCSLGLSLAIVKEVADSKDDTPRLARIIAVASRLVMFTAIAGALVCVIASRWLSIISFGNDDYSWQFMLLAVSIFFTVAAAGKMSVLQGLHEISTLSKASVIGGCTGLFAGVPLYYYFGNLGIVPAMTIFSVVMFAFYTIAVRRKTGKEKLTFRWKEHFPLAKKLVALGVILMASELLMTLFGYLFNIFLREFGSLDDVGFYQAANSLTTQSLGMVFTAMSLDYFPRLSAAASDTGKMNSIVNRQATLIALATPPLAIALIAAAPIAVQLLLSPEFEVTVPLLRIMALAVMLKSLSFPMGYISFAKENKQLFFILEGIVCNVLTFALPAAGFYLYGLTGAGWGMVADNAACIIIYYIVNRHYYNYRLSRQALGNYLTGLVLTAAALSATWIDSDLLSAVALGCLCIASTSLSFVRLRKLMR